MYIMPCVAHCFCSLIPFVSNKQANHPARQTYSNRKEKEELVSPQSQRSLSLMNFAVFILISFLKNGLLAVVLCVFLPIS